MVQKEIEIGGRVYKIVAGSVSEGKAIYLEGPRGAGFVLSWPTANGQRSLSSLGTCKGRGGRGMPRALHKWVGVVGGLLVEVT